MAGKILVVDDDPLAVRLMKLSLVSEGFQVSTAANAFEALRAVQTERPDLIVLDIMMPDIDGVQLCRHLRSQPATANIPIVFLTAKTQLDDKIAGLQAGADDYITKPADPREVVVRVQAVLARTRRAASSQQGRVLAIIGAKGGVGTSTIALNLGVALAKQQMSILLLDLHHNASTAAWQLKLPARASLADMLALPADQITPREVEKTLVAHSSGLRVLFGAPVSAKLVELPEAHATAFIRSAASLAEVVLLDLPHMLSPASKQALSLSDMVILVLSPDPLTVACAEQIVPFIESASMTGETVAFVIVNRVQSAVGLTVSEIERRLQKRCLGMMPPALEELAFADRQGVPLVLSPTQSVATIALREMAERVQDKIAGRAPRPH